MVELKECESAYLNSATLGLFEWRAAADRQAGSGFHSDADALYLEPARFIARAFARDLRRRLDRSILGPAGFLTVAGFFSVGSSVRARWEV